MDSGMSRRGSSGCGGCLCFAFILMLFATVSPYWVWRSAWMSGSTTSTVASGSFVASSSSASIYTWPYKYYITSQWNHFDVFVNDPEHMLCKDNVQKEDTAGLTKVANYYTNIGKYGWCDNGEGGAVNMPSKISSIQGLSTACTIVLFVASLLALIAPNTGGTKLGLAAAVLALTATCLSCAAFSVAVSYDWYQTFGTAGYLPFYDSAKNMVTMSNAVNLYWGPAFWSTVTVFIISLFATFSLFAVSKQLDDDIDGTYGAGGAAYEDPTADYGGQQADDFAYGVDKA